MSGCVTTRTEFKVVDLSWKKFPELETTYNDETDEVSMSLDEYEKLYKFKNWYEGQIKYYNKIKELYEEAE